MQFQIRFFTNPGFVNECHIDGINGNASDALPRILHLTGNIYANERSPLPHMIHFTGEHLHINTYINKAHSVTPNEDILIL